MMRFVILAGLVAFAAATADVSLTISDIREVNGTRYVDIYMANTEEVRGFQFRIIQPDGSRLPVAAAGGGLAGKYGFQVSTSPVTGAAIGFSMVGAKLPVNTRQVLLTSLKISNDFQPKSLETCLSNEYFPVFASTASDAAALSVSIPECKNEISVMEHEVNLAEKALEDPSQGPVVLSYSEINYDENHPGKASVDIYMSNRNPVAGFQFRVVRSTDGAPIPVLSAKEGRAAEMKFQVSGGPSGIAMGVSFAGDVLDVNPEKKVLTTLILDAANLDQYTNKKICLKDIVFAGKSANSLPVSVPECILSEPVVDGEVKEGLTKSEAAIQGIEKAITDTKGLIKDDAEKDDGSAQDYGDKEDYSKEKTDYEAVVDDLPGGTVKLTLGPLQKHEGGFSTLDVFYASDQPIRGFQFRVVDQKEGRAPVTGASGGAASIFQVTTSPITGAVIGFSMIGQNIPATKKDKKQLLTTLAMGIDFATPIACISTRDPPVMANTPHSGPLAVEYDDCPALEDGTGKESRSVFTGGAVTEPEVKIETDKDGSVLDVEEASVILSFTEPQISPEDPNQLLIGIKMRSKTPIRGFQFMVASGEGTGLPIEVSRKHGLGIQIFDSVTVNPKNGMVLGFSMRGDEIPVQTTPVLLLELFIRKDRVRFTTICLRKPVFAGLKDSLPVALPECAFAQPSKSARESIEHTVERGAIASRARGARGSTISGRGEDAAHTMTREQYQQEIKTKERDQFRERREKLIKEHDLATGRKREQHRTMSRQEIIRELKLAGRHHEAKMVADGRGNLEKIQATLLDTSMDEMQDDRRYHTADFRMDEDVFSRDRSDMAQNARGERSMYRDDIGITGSRNIDLEMEEITTRPSKRGGKKKSHGIGIGLIIGCVVVVAVIGVLVALNQQANKSYYSRGVFGRKKVMEKI